MCYMIVVGLSEKGVDKWLARLPERITVRPSDRTASLIVMGGFQPMFVTTGMCACDLYQPISTTKIDGRRKKYKRKGWSKARSERALSKQKPKGFVGNLDPSLRIWLAEAAQEIGQAYLFVYWISDGFICVAKRLWTHVSLRTNL